MIKNIFCMEIWEFRIFLFREFVDVQQTKLLGRVEVWIEMGFGTEDKWGISVYRKGERFSLSADL